MKLEIKEAGGVYKKSVLRMDNDYSLCTIDKEDFGIFEEIVMRSNLHEELIGGLKEIIEHEKERGLNDILEHNSAHGSEMYQSKSLRTLLNSIEDLIKKAKD